ncbi:hypothetical protein ACERII_21860 [Evansella sp. AB-rgal1]|uniref:hypothetical protein n=1 Tax=Evansella sp. AB-rgal1 TaxID=3242696 RepID=UPI00359ED734
MEAPRTVPSASLNSEWIDLSIDEHHVRKEVLYHLRRENHITRRISRYLGEKSIEERELNNVIRETTHEELMTSIEETYEELLKEIEREYREGVDQ